MAKAVRSPRHCRVSCSRPAASPLPLSMACMDGGAPAEIVVLGDFWSPMSEIKAMLAGLSSSGAHGALVKVVDPAEETFPYSGRVEFIEPESGNVITAGRAEKWVEDYVARVAMHRD